MNHFEELRQQIPQYLAGEMSHLERVRFEQQLSEDAELRAAMEEMRVFWEGLELLPKAEPSAALRARFYQRLNTMTRGEQPAGRGLWSWWKARPALHWGAGLLLFVTGMYVGRETTSVHVSSREVAQLRGEVQTMRQMVALSLLDEKSANARLEGVSWGTRVEQPDREVSTALLTALNHDPNVNVRLSSVDALQKFAGDGAIRKALVDSLPAQDSPLVQISLIDLLVQMRAREAAGELQRLSTDAQSDPNVRSRAKWAIQKLQS